MRRPTIRFAYWIGIRRWPSWMKTTATMIAERDQREEELLHRAAVDPGVDPGGSEVRIEAKISSEMPLPMPRFVISSPIHISSVVPAVSVITIRTRRPALKSSAPWRWKRNA